MPLTFSCAHKSKTITAKAIAAKSRIREAVHVCYPPNPIGKSITRFKSERKRFVKRVRKLTVCHSKDEFDSTFRSSFLTSSRPARARMCSVPVKA